MALFKSQILTQASGSVGGLTYTRGASGLVMRARAKPVNTTARRQTDAANAFTQAVLRWRQVLTAAQRASWELYAQNVPRTSALGDQRPRTGLNLFIHRALLVNRVLRLDPENTLLNPTDAPTIFNRSHAGLRQIDFAFASGDVIQYGFDDSLPWNTTAGGLLLFVSAPTNPSRQPLAQPFRVAHWLDGDVVTSPPDAFDTNSNAGYQLNVGQAVAIKAVALTPDGRVSEPEFATAIVI